MGLATLGAVAGGINRGMDMNQRDREIEEQRQFRAEDRAFQDSQRQRQLEEQAREDTFRKDAQSLAAPGTIKAAKDSDAGPVPVQQTQVGYARDLAGALQRKGDVAKATEMFRWADETASKTAAERAVGTMRSLPKTATPYDIVNALAPAIDADESPIGIKDIVKGEDGKSVKVKLFNKLTGYTQEQEFSDTAALRDALTYHYAPDYAREQEKSRAALAAKVAEERAKGVKLAPGEERYDYNAEGALVPAASNNRTTSAEARIAALERGAVGGSGASTGAGKGAKVDDPVKAAAEAVFEQATKGEIKLQPSQLSDAQLRAAQISARGVPLYVAANVAIKVAQDPTLLKPRIDPKTGFIESVYEDGAVGQVVVDRDIATARNPKGMTTDQLKGFAKQVVSSVSNPEAQKSLVAAAFDPAARQKVEQQLTAEIGKQFDQMLQANPAAKASIEAQRSATVKSSLEALGRKLDLIGSHYPKPAEDKPEQKPASIKDRVGGISAGRFSGMTPRQIDETVAQEARDFRAQNKRTVLDSKAAARDPDIIRLTAEKEAALRAGKPVVANAKIEEIKKIQAERHMVQR